MPRSLIAAESRKFLSSCITASLGIFGFVAVVVAYWIQSSGLSVDGNLYFILSVALPFAVVSFVFFFITSKRLSK